MFTSQQLKRTHLPASSHTISLYITHLHTNLNLKGVTIRTHLSAIAYYHQMAGHHSPTEGFIIEKLLLSYSKQDSSPKTRRSITPNILEQLIQSIKTSEKTNYTKQLFTALFCIMFHALLRCSEVTKSKNTNHNLKSNQINLSKSKRSIRVAFTSFKHSKPNPSPLKIKENRQISCPVHAWKQYAAIRNTAADTFFCHPDGKPLARNYVVQMLKKHLAITNHCKHDYNTHSFRIGKATAMAKAGHSHSQIALAGRWSSNAFLKYIKPSHVSI